MLSARLSPSPRVKRRKQADKSQQRRQGVVSWSGSIGQELEQLAQERTIHTDPRETRRRRTLRLVRQDSHSCWGFTLQTYGIRHKQTGEMEVMTYVDYVEIGSAAWIAGMRKGDVVLSVNGDSVEGLTHHTLVTKIQSGHDVLRLVVLFEDCCRKVELYERFIKLKRILAQKKRELCQLDHQERVLCSGGLLSPVGFSRGSVRSSTSSDWDRYSELGSPTTPATPEPSAPGGSPGTWPPHSPDTLTVPGGGRLRVSGSSSENNGLVRVAFQSSASSPSPPFSSTSHAEVAGEEMGSKSDGSGVRITVTDVCADIPDRKVVVIEKKEEKEKEEREEEEKKKPQHSTATTTTTTTTSLANHSWSTKGENEKPRHSATTTTTTTFLVSHTKQEQEEEEEEEEGRKEALNIPPSPTPNSGESSSSSSDSDSEAEPPPVCRMRSNSTILIEMRMKLLADIVCVEATAAAKLLEEGEEEEEKKEEEEEEEDEGKYKDDGEEEEKMEEEEEEEEEEKNTDGDSYQVSDFEVIGEVEGEEQVTQNKKKKMKKEEEEKKKKKKNMDADSYQVSDSEIIIQVKGEEEEEEEERKGKEGGKTDKEDEEVEGELRGVKKTKTIVERDDKKERKKKKEEEEEEEGEDEEKGVSFRLCRGVRVNDRDQITRL